MELACCDWLRVSHRCIQLCGVLCTQVRWQVACHDLVAAGLVPASPQSCRACVVVAVRLLCIVHSCLHLEVPHNRFIDDVDVLAQSHHSIRWQAQALAHLQLLSAEEAATCWYVERNRGTAMRS